MKTVYKPWGKEIWLELNDKYCYKRIYINAGTKTSYQYHEKKLETNYIISGTAEVWLENDDGIVEKKLMEPGDFFTVTPPKKHRVIAVTDIILQEVSTPEVDDVIRIEDDCGRSSGKIEHEHMKPALCILAAGTGSRLGKLADFINKGLLPLNNKAIISYIIDKTSDDYEIIIALGYKGNMVREYCLAAHPDRKFIFVEVDKFEGEGTGPAYSINQCKKHLQRPFIWVTADTIISEDLPKLDDNWLGLYPTSIPELYSTAKIDGDHIVDFKNKDKNGYEYAFIGIASIYDYETFWNELDVDSGEIVSAFYRIGNYSGFKAKFFDWYDVGTIDSYMKAKKLFENSVSYSIPKTNGEFLYKVNNNFIKLFADEKAIRGRINRTEYLKGLVPDLNYTGNNLYSYKWIDGSTLYDLNDIDVWKNFISFARDNLWTIDNTIDISGLCQKFYKDKTLKRLELFLSNRDGSYKGKHIVNGTETRAIHKLLEEFDWDSVLDGLATRHFHGDLQFDNVLYGDDGKFYLLDWRQDFGGDTTIGDVYYDLSKLYGGILMSYKLMKDDTNFSISANGNVVNYEHKLPTTLKKFKPDYESWLKDNSFDLDRVKRITALIFLNMSPLHEKGFGDLLFFKSKEMIEELVK